MSCKTSTQIKAETDGVSTPTKPTSYKPPTTPVRAGSQDAFKKPSIVGGKPQPYTGKQIGCVGVLKDRRNHHNEN